MSTSVVHCKKDKYDVYIGRPSKWGNPYTHIMNKQTKAAYVVGTRIDAIESYRKYLLSSPLYNGLHELKDKVLGCWCYPYACHGDVLAAYTDKTISRFKGFYSFLSNFYPCEIEFEGITYTSVEHAYQAAKFLDTEKRLYISKLNAAQAKKAGRSPDIRPDWQDISIDIMTHLNNIKFSSAPLKDMLINTGDLYIVEGNYWHDNFWGNCTCSRCKNRSGENILGKILMKIRSNL